MIISRIEKKTQKDGVHKATTTLDNISCTTYSSLVPAYTITHLKGSVKHQWAALWIVCTSLFIGRRCHFEEFLQYQNRAINRVDYYYKSWAYKSYIHPAKCQISELLLGLLLANILVRLDFIRKPSCCMHGSMAPHWSIVCSIKKNNKQIKTGFWMQRSDVFLEHMIHLHHILRHRWKSEREIGREGWWMLELWTEYFAFVDYLGWWAHIAGH